MLLHFSAIGGTLELGCRSYPVGVRRLFFMATKKRTTQRRTGPRGGSLRDNELAARVLAEAHIGGSVVRVLEKHKIPQRTYFDWLNALSTDAVLAHIYTQRVRELVNQNWADELNAGLRKLINKLVDLVDGLEQSSPANIEIVLQVVKELSDLELTRYGLQNEYAPENRRAEASHSTAASQAPAQGALGLN